MGNYVSEATEHTNDGIPCDVNMKLNESFSLFSFTNNVDMDITFYLDESFDFPNLTMTYSLSVDGDWSYRDSLLTVEVDTASFCCTYIGSDAKTPTEESMVRQLRRNVISGELMPVLRDHIIESSVRSVRVYEINDSSLVVENPVNHGKRVMNKCP
ncbi:MAG: hypothetical protein MJZ13_02260 [Bacteroidales bacterium]|nr:hypothetical protein [Bacteroidales bacterium]